MLAVVLTAWKADTRRHSREKKEWTWFLVLGLAVPVSILIFTVHLTNENALPIPDLGGLAQGPLLPVLGAVPWVLAIVRLGAIPGVILAALSGLFVSSLDTRSPFTPLEYGLVAALFAASLNQQYGTRFFAWLRNPMVTALLIALVYPLLYVVAAIFWAAPSLAASLDFAFSRVTWVGFGMGVQLLFGALFLMLLQARYPTLFAAPEKVAQPAPQERSLEGRLLFALGPIVLLAFISLGALGWWTAGRAADQLLGERMGSSARIASESLPFFLETGQNLILQLAVNPNLSEASRSDANSILEAHLRAAPYFEQFFLLDTAGNTRAGYPAPDFNGLQPSEEEFTAIALALQGVSLQYLAIPPLEESAAAAQLSFIVPVRNANGQVRSVLVGRTNLASNPFAQPILQSLQSVDQFGGQGLLIDDTDRIVIAPTVTSLLRPYNGRAGGSPLTYTDIGPDGARRQVHYEPSTGSNWAVVAQWPARLSQQLALDIALPLMSILLLLAVAAYAALRVTLRAITASLQQLINESQRIAAGNLQASLETGGTDEIGRLSKAFEEMRRALKSRMEEVQRLLAVSRGVASTLEIGGHIDPILEAALASGASSARLVFDDGKHKPGSLVGFGKGPATDKYKSLDAQILTFTRAQDRVLITNPARARLKVAREQPLPQSLAAFAMKKRGENLGALWLAFDDTRTFSPEATSYLETLADQAAQAVDNARLFLEAQLAKERTEGVLTSSPEPILVTDAQDKLQIANPAAIKLFGLSHETSFGKEIRQVITLNEFRALLDNEGSFSTELVMPDGRFFQATITPIEKGGSALGRVLTLRDISAFKLAEGLRAEFMSTVSHDLRDPLELIRGYLSMLSMVGELNEQQSAYVEKIEQNVEGISQLASDLLDTERITVGEGLRYQTISLPDLVQEVIREFGTRALQKKIAIRLQISGGSAAVEADRILLYRAVYNLIDNAIKFSPRGESIDVEIIYSEEKVRIEIKDHGAGIAPVDLATIFDRQMVSGKRAFGLGIVKSIIERHKGRVWAESELGLGSSFIAELPLKRLLVD